MSEKIAESHAWNTQDVRPSEMVAAGSGSLSQSPVERREGEGGRAGVKTKKEEERERRISSEKSRIKEDQRWNNPASLEGRTAAMERTQTTSRTR